MSGNTSDNKRQISFVFLQLLIWTAVVVLAPLLTYLIGGQWEPARMMLQILASQLLPCVVIYFLNYFLLVPRLFFRDRKLIYLIANVFAIMICNAHMLYFLLTQDRSFLPPGAWLGITTAGMIKFVLDAGTVGLALAVRSHIRAREIREQLVEEKHKRTEAELVWLKNQLNPHFLFNSLNNISSLVILDSDRAQNAISQLSDLLRYAMYESDNKAVPLAKELEFMRNYIDLMSLRCSDSTTVTCRMSHESASATIAPLLLISMIENAFKHGVSSNRPSFIDVSLTESGRHLEFSCVNSNHSKSAGDRSGNGIGIANMRRRLDLLYPGRYSWECRHDNETYSLKITIDL